MTLFPQLQYANFLGLIPCSEVFPLALSQFIRAADLGAGGELALSVKLFLSSLNLRAHSLLELPAAFQGYRGSSLSLEAWDKGL